jgi:hypothetical protein
MIVEVLAGFFAEQCPFGSTFDLLIFADTTEQRYSKVTKLPHRPQEEWLGTDLLGFARNLDHRFRSFHRLSRRAI